MITAVYWVLPFGWTGSPGEWMVWAWLIKGYHAAHRPANERWNDTTPFHSHFLMDDQVLIEPDLGTRAAQSNEAARAGIRLCLGADAINQAKELEEGTMSTRRLCWGLTYDTLEGTVEMPEPKIEKAKVMLSDPSLDHGCTRIVFAFLEQYRGE